MKILVCVIIAIAFYTPVHAQAVNDSIKVAVNDLFTAMKNSDAALIKASFTDSAILQSIEKNKTGVVKIINEQVQEFADFIATQEKGSLDEQITFDVIKINGDLAMVWAPYRFYFKGKFSHCGVDSFQLVRINNKWKIQYLIDTRSKSGCN